MPLHFCCLFYLVSLSRLGDWGGTEVGFGYRQINILQGYLTIMEHTSGQKKKDRKIVFICQIQKDGLIKFEFCTSCVLRIQSGDVGHPWESHGNSDIITIYNKGSARVTLNSILEPGYKSYSLPTCIIAVYNTSSSA